jgi:integrase
VRKPKKKALYSASYGRRGLKVRVWEYAPGSNFLIAPRIDGKYRAESLGHRDPKKAEDAAYALIAAMQAGDRQVAQQTAETDTLTLATLVDLYFASESFRGLKERQQVEKRAALERIVSYFGPAKKVAALDKDAVAGLIHARRKGAHGWKAAGQQTVYNTYAHLRSVVMWGLEKRTASGAPLVRTNPLSGMAKGLKIRPNKSPLQPVISHPTYTLLRKGARSLPLYVRVFLVLAEGTGRRAGAIRALEWKDVSFRSGRILWKGMADKMNLQMARAMSDSVMRYLRVWREHCPSDRWVFPAPEDASRPVPKVTVDKWIRQLYASAGLEKPRGAGWHSLRRKWASERSGYPIPVLMAAGGWASEQALMRYLKTDAEEVDAATLTPTRRIGESKVIGKVIGSGKAGSPKVA